MRPVTNKADMYRRLAAGGFGNTILQYFSMKDWIDSPDYMKYKLWGIRSVMAGGDRRCKLNVPREEVAELYWSWFPNGGGNISPMIDIYVVLRGEVIYTRDAPQIGLSLFYVPPKSKIDPADPWRGSFRNFGEKVYGPSAWLILRAYLWPSDFEDLCILLDEFPEHSVEFSACNRAVGMVSHRNTIIWEVRRY